MSDFLRRLLGGQAAHVPVLRPRLPGRFAPPDVMMEAFVPGEESLSLRDVHESPRGRADYKDIPPRLRVEEFEASALSARPLRFAEGEHMYLPDQELLSPLRPGVASNRGVAPDVPAARIEELQHPDLHKSVQTHHSAPTERVEPGRRRAALAETTAHRTLDETVPTGVASLSTPAQRPDLHRSVQTHHSALTERVEPGRGRAVLAETTAHRTLDETVPTGVASLSTPAQHPDLHKSVQTHHSALTERVDARDEARVLTNLLSGPKTGPTLKPRINEPTHASEATVSRSVGTRPAAAALTVATEPPVVRISIGRIDVHVAQPSVPARPSVAPRPVAMSLDTYLQRREGRIP